MAAEIALVLVVLVLQGGWPVPDVNEPYYLGKAKHCWNDDWARGDFFLQTEDSHAVFYYTFGWLSLLMPLPVLAWFGRFLTWGLMAWAWRRLSFALIPRRWISVLTAALFAGLLDHCHMAGEWVVGGVEAKGFAFVLVFLGLEAVARSRWNRAWLLLGAASAFHVLVGGWSVVAAALAWFWVAEDRPSIRSMGPALAGGFLLSLPGLVPSLMLTWGAPGETVAVANQIYVFQRLGHHLAFRTMQPEFIFRFAALTACWGALCWVTPADGPGRRLRGFVAGALGIAMVGVAIELVFATHPAAAARLLRFYWFRLSDVAVPMGVAFVAVAWVLHCLETRPKVGRYAAAVVLTMAVLHTGGYAVRRMIPVVPRAVKEDWEAWRDITARIVRHEDIAPDARFLTPRYNQTFKWYTGHAEVVNRKEIPQDAEAIVEWWRRMRMVYAVDPSETSIEMQQLPGANNPWRLLALGRQFDADYALTTTEPGLLRLPIVCKNDKYVVYRLPEKLSPQ